MAEYTSRAGTTYVLRADLNVLGSLQARYGSMDAAVRQTDSVAELLKIAAEMINEDRLFCGRPDRITAAQLGAELTGADLAGLTEAVSDAVAESMGVDMVKKKRPPRAGKRRFPFRSGG